MTGAACLRTRASTCVRVRGERDTEGNAGEKANRTGKKMKSSCTSQKIRDPALVLKCLSLVSPRTLLRWHGSLNATKEIMKLRAVHTSAGRDVIVWSGRQMLGEDSILLGNTRLIPQPRCRGGATSFPLISCWQRRYWANLELATKWTDICRPIGFCKTWSTQDHEFLRLVHSAFNSFSVSAQTGAQWNVFQKYFRYISGNDLKVPARWRVGTQRVIGWTSSMSHVGDVSHRLLLQIKKKKA